MQCLDNVKSGREESWRHDTFYKDYSEQSKTKKDENSKPINLTFYLDYGTLRKEHSDTLADFINRQEKFKGSLTLVPTGHKSRFNHQIGDKSKVIAKMAITSFWCER